MSKNWINVGICFDFAMLDAAYVLLASIKAHAPPERPVRVFALIDFQSDDIAVVSEKMKNEAFEFVPIVCENVHGTFPIRDHITAGTYLRFLLPDKLPDIDKIIYLDVDVVVKRSLHDLFEVALSGMALAAMPDWPMIVGTKTWPDFFVPYEGARMSFWKYARKVLDLESEHRDEYFNCGVMVLDLDFWRKNHIAARAVEYLSVHPDLFYMDQDALNAVIRGRYVRLDLRWNAFANCSFPALTNALIRFRAVGRRWEAIRTSWRRDAWIVHYAGPNKPWRPGHANTPRDTLWWHYASLSPIKSDILRAYRSKETPDQARKSKVPAAFQ